MFRLFADVRISPVHQSQFLIYLFVPLAFFFHSLFSHFVLVDWLHGHDFAIAFMSSFWYFFLNVSLSREVLFFCMVPGFVKALVSCCPNQGRCGAAMHKSTEEESSKGGKGPLGVDFKLRDGLQQFCGCFTCSARRPSRSRLMAGMCDAPRLRNDAAALPLNRETFLANEMRAKVHFFRKTTYSQKAEICLTCTQPP